MPPKSFLMWQHASMFLRYIKEPATISNILAVPFKHWAQRYGVHCTSATLPFFSMGPVPYSTMPNEGISTRQARCHQAQPQWIYTHTEQPCTHPACLRVPTDSLYTPRGNPHRLWRHTRPISGTAQFVTPIVQGTPHQNHLPLWTLAALRHRGLLPCQSEQARMHLI